MDIKYTKKCVKRVFLIGSIGRKNVGDDAICFSLAQTILNLLKSKVSIYIYTRNNYFNQNFKLTLKNIKFISSFNKIFKSFINSEYIVIGGGDYIGDCGPFFHKVRTYSIFLLLAFLTRIFGKKLVMLNSGFFVNSGKGLALLKIILRHTYYISARDDHTFSLLIKHIPKKVYKGFDTAILYDSTDYPLPFASSKDKCINNLGLSLNPIFYDLKSEELKLLPNIMAKYITNILSKNKGLVLHFLVLNTDMLDGDLVFLTSVMRMLDASLLSQTKLIIYTGDLGDFLNKFSKLDAVVCCKHHSAIFSYYFEKPMIIVGYHPKNASLVSSIKLDKRAFLSAQDVIDGKLFSASVDLMEHADKFRAMLPIYEAKKRAFDCILKSLEIDVNEL